MTNKPADSGARIRVWDLPVRLFHWALAGSFAIAYFLSESERQRTLHVNAGYVALGLVAFRLVWGFVGSHYARFGSFLYSPREALKYLRDVTRGSARHYLGHNPAGSYAIYAILLLTVATGVSGYMVFNEIGGGELEDLHEFFANAWLVVVVMHVGGVILSSIAHRENLARAMVTGDKRNAGTRSGPSRKTPTPAQPLSEHD